jgi:glucose-6-phosphate isomerase
MNIVQSIESAREEKVGSHGIGADVLKTALTRAESALVWIRVRHADRALPLLRLPETRADLEVIRNTARQLADRATDIVILGTGGSSLGGQTLAQLAGFAVPGVGAFRPPPQLHFIDNLDPDSFETLLATLPHATTRFVAISKSGGTAETLMQTIAALSALREAGLQPRIPDIFLGISEPSRSGKTNGLRDLLGKFRVPMLDHDTRVGGRYSALTSVGLVIWSRPRGAQLRKTLAKNGCPVRTIHISRLDEAALGELMMHFMLETIIAALLLGVDPFDQPGWKKARCSRKSI